LLTYKCDVITGQCMVCDSREKVFFTNFVTLLSHTSLVRFMHVPTRLGLPYVIRQAVYIFILSFVLPFFPRLILAVADWMSAILPHMVWP